MNKYKLDLYLFILSFPFQLSGQDDPAKVGFVTAGKIYVAPAYSGNQATLTIPNSYRTIDEAITNQQGTTAIGGNFYHDAHTHAFTVGPDGWGTSSGSVVFRDWTENATRQRYIGRYDPADMQIFDRTAYYIAFPHIVINTNDTLNIPAQMGLDATSIHVGAGKTGFVALRSNVGANGDKVFDASLRISGGGSSETLVDAGSVVVERDLSLYRIGGATIADYPLFAFASPVKNMKSGYFAGNWIRKLKSDPNNYDHVNWVYGNEDANGDGIIDPEQYIRDPLEPFQTGKGYLIKARPALFNYNQLAQSGGLNITGAESSLYDQDKFIFNGNIYSLQNDFKEQLFAEETLFSQSLNRVKLGKTVNWIIGNSWTSAISVESLVQMIEDHSLVFEPSIYVYPAGSATYQRYNLINTVNGIPSIAVIPELKDIPSQSIFMLRLLSGNQDGVFTLSKRNLQTHGSAVHNMLRSTTAGFQDEILFRVTPESNEHIYDLAAVGLRSNAKTSFDAQDMSKMYQENSTIFLLYSLSDDNRKLAVNTVPYGTKSVKLCFHPGDNGGRMTLSALRTESIAQVWLEDLFTHEMINLKEQDSYSFTASPQDTPERFIVHFEPIATQLKKVSDSFLQAYYIQGKIVVKGLKKDDVGAEITLVDMQGRTLKRVTVTTTPEFHFPIQMAKGIYILHLRGNRTIATKFQKND